MELRQATRKKAKIRLGLSAVSGGGKTYSALLIARGLSSSWEKVAIIDTENGSADLYSHLGNYNVITLNNHSPEDYIAAITTCEKAGMETIITDSITHEWDWCLDYQSQIGGKYQDWAKVSPRHEAFKTKIINSNCHIITTVRRKQDYDMIKDSNGRTKVEKAGLKEQTREGWEYELTINLELDIRHFATAGKDRTGLFMDKPAFIPTIETGELIKNWCELGIDPYEQERKEFNQFKEEIDKIGSIEGLGKIASKWDYRNKPKEWQDLIKNKNNLLKQAEIDEGK